MTNVVIYARYSSHNQTECSIEGQIEECKRYAELNDYNVINTYIDRAKSGTKDNREEFLKMIEDSKKKEFKYIIVYQLDRFARNRYDSAIYKKELKTRDIRVLSSRENITEDASGVLMESMLEGMAEYYSLELGQKVKRGMNYNGENFYYNGGTVPLGFKLQEITINIENSIKPIIKKKYILDNEKASIVQKIFEMYANGSKMVEIISTLNSLGVKTAYNKSFNKSSIRRILENKKYIGTYTYNGIETSDAIPRIVSDELFNRVQMELVKNGLAPSRNRAKNEYLLTGKLYCGDCKEKMTGTSGTSKTKELHTYYICKNSKAHKNCTKKRIKKDYLEDLVVLFAKKTLTNENIDKIAKKIVDIANNEQNNQVLKTINKNIKENEKKKNNLLQAIAECEDAIVRKTLFDEIAKLTQLDTIYNNALIEEKSKHLQLNYKEVKYFLTRIKNNNINDFKYKKMLINILINKVYIYQNKAVIVYNVSNVKQEIDLSLINNIECSLVDANALPNRNLLQLLEFFYCKKYFHKKTLFFFCSVFLFLIIV